MLPVQSNSRNDIIAALDSIIGMEGKEKPTPEQQIAMLKNMAAQLQSKIEPNSDMAGKLIVIIGKAPTDISRAAIWALRAVLFTAGGDSTEAATPGIIRAMREATDEASAASFEHRPLILMHMKAIEDSLKYNRPAVEFDFAGGVRITKRHLKLASLDI
jgi:hypothetical protein